MGNSRLREHPAKQYPQIGACGLACGLCPRFYTRGPSRCPGCAGPGFHEKHPTCSFISCCVKKRHLEVCAACPDFPCGKFKTEGEYELEDSRSYPSSRRVLANLHRIRADGLETFVRQLDARMRLLERMIADFDDGRSRSFFCRAAESRDPEALAQALPAAKAAAEAGKLEEADRKARAAILRRMIEDLPAAE